ncbi:GlxA family transcriptional regulator [Marinobacter similis]
MLKKTFMMIKIAIVALPFCHGSGVIGVMDFFAAANYCDRWVNRDDPRFECQIVTVDDEPVHSYSGVPIVPTVNWRDYPADVIIIGSAMEAVLGDRHIDAALDISRPLHPWLRAAIERGAIVASVCTGSFVLAEAGLLEQHVATTHWRAAPAFRRRYPKLRLESDQLLVDNGQILCAGGATSFMDLCLYLVERLGSPALAVACSKLLILDARRSEQTPYMSFYGSRAHQDEKIGEVQGWLEQHFADAIVIDELAERVHLGPYIQASVQGSHRRDPAELPAAFENRGRQARTRIDATPNRPDHLGRGLRRRQLVPATVQAQCRVHHGRVSPPVQLCDAQAQQAVRGDFCRLSARSLSVTLGDSFKLTVCPSSIYSLLKIGNHLRIGAVAQRQVHGRFTEHQYRLEPGNAMLLFSNQRADKAISNPKVGLPQHQPARVHITG